MVILVLFAYLAVPHIPVETLTEGSFGSIGQRFELRLLESNTKKHSPQNIIIGSCYAANIGSFDNFLNLGIAGSHPKDHIIIMKSYIHSSDQIFYFISFRDVIQRDMPARPICKNRAMRRILIFKEFFHDLILTGKTPRRSRCDNFSEREPIYKLLCESTNSQSLPLLRRSETYLDMNILLGNRNTCSHPLIDVAHLRKMHTLFPNTIFVVSPMLPISHTESETLMAKQINCCVRVLEDFRNALLKSGLPVIDISDCVPADLFYDFVHFDKKAHNKVRNLLKKHQQSMQPYSRLAGRAS